MLESRTQNGTTDSPSAKDWHLLPQGYNDWFLFRTEADARAYLDGKAAFVAELKTVSAEIANWAEALLANGLTLDNVKHRLRHAAELAEAA